MKTKTMEPTGVRELSDSELEEAQGGLIWRVGSLYCGVIYDENMPGLPGRVFCGNGTTLLSEIPF